MDFKWVFDSIYNALDENPYISILLLSFIANSIPYLPLPYYFLLLIFTEIIKNFKALMVIAILSGIGATLGKMMIYMIGRGASRIVSEKKERI